MPKKHTHRCLKTQNDPVDPIKHFRSTLAWTRVLHAGRQNQLPWFFIWFYVLHFYSFFMLIHKTRTPWYEWTPLMSFFLQGEKLESWMTLWLIWILYFPFVFSVLNVNLQISGSVPCVWREQTAFCFSLRLMLFFFSFVKHIFENTRAKMLVPLSPWMLQMSSNLDGNETVLVYWMNWIQKLIA